MKKSQSAKQQPPFPHLQLKSNISRSNSILSSSVNFSSQNHQSFSTSPLLKLSFYHRNYLLPFKLSISTKPILPSINYKILQKEFQQILPEQLIFSTPEEKSLLHRINLNYLQSFLNAVESQKKMRFTKDFMGQNKKQYLFTIGNRWISHKKEENNQAVSSQYANFFQKIGDLIEEQEINAKRLKQIINEFLNTFGQNDCHGQFGLKQTLTLLKFLQLTYFTTDQQPLNESENNKKISQIFLIFLILLKLSNGLLTSLHSNHQQLHAFFLVSLSLLEQMILTFENFINIFEPNDKFIVLSENLSDLSQQYIKQTAFVWTYFHKIIFSGIIQKNQENLEAERNFPTYKASILVKTNDLIHLNINLKRIILSLKHNKENTNLNNKKSVIDWLLNEQTFQQTEKDCSIFVNFKSLPSLKKQIHFYINLGDLYKNFAKQSILEHLINEISLQKRRVQEKQIMKRRNLYKSSFFFQNFRIQNNLFFLGSLLKLNKQILETYIHPLVDNEQEQKSVKRKISTNQLLLFVTETIRFQLPEHIKRIQEAIKQRKYKNSDTCIIRNILNHFNGTLASAINESVLSQMYVSQWHVFNANFVKDREDISYFRIKELLHIVKPSQDEFLKLCKVLLKDVRFLSKEYHNFRSGKIIMEKRQSENTTTLEDKWKLNFVKKRREIRQDENGQNFYEVYYFNNQSSKQLKNMVEVGVNVNLIDEQFIKMREMNLQSKKGRIQAHIAPKTLNLMQISQDNQIKADSIAHENNPLNQNPNNYVTAQQKNSFNRFSLPELRNKIRKLSDSTQKPQIALISNDNNEIPNFNINNKDSQMIELFRQNQELLKVNAWYQEQLRNHQGKQEKLESIIAQIISFNKIKEDKLQKRRKQLNFCSNILKQKITASQFSTNKKVLHHIDELAVRNSFNSNRLSKDSIQNRSREKSIAHLRLIHDLNKLSAPISNDPMNPSSFILPPLPPPPTSIGNSMGLPLLPPPPLFNIPIPSFLPPPPPLPSLFLPPPLNLPLPSLTQVQQDQKQPRKQMKNFGWTMVDVTAIPSSFWQNVQEMQFDKQDVIVNFSKTPQIITPKIVATKENKMEKKSILRPDRVKNIEIGLKKTKLRYDNMKNLQQILYNYDQNYFDEDIIDCLISLIPSQKQKEQLASITIKQQEKTEWTIADYFLTSLINIQSYEERLKAIHFKNEFASINQELIQKINIFIEFFQEFKNDQFMQSFLTYLLSVGNFLNAKSHKSNAYGFRFQSIPKSYTLIGQDHQTSLFEYVLKLMFSKNEDLFAKYLNYSYFEPQNTKTLTSLNIIEEDFKLLTREIQNIQEIIIYSKQQDDNSSKYLLLFYIQAQEQINTLKKLISEAKTTYEQVLEFYCQKMSSEQIIHFVLEFRKRVKEFIKVNLKKKAGNQHSRISWAASQRYSMYN